jgi:hypothetical protein
MLRSAVLAVLLAACCVPATARAQLSDNYDLTRGTTGHGIVRANTEADCESPAPTPQGSEVHCASVSAFDFENCIPAQRRCNASITAVNVAGWHFTKWVKGPCNQSINTVCTFQASETICDVNDDCNTRGLGPWTAVAEFVDDRAPTMQFRTAPADGSVVLSDTRRQDIAFGTDEDDEQPALQCARDGGMFANCASPDVRANLTDGIHSECIKGKDPSGKDSTNQPCRTWQQETNPTATIQNAPPAATTATGASFTYTSNKLGHAADGSTLNFECKLDAQAFAPCLAAGQSYSGLADGTHTFSVQAVFHAQLDPALARHVSAAATRTWTIDTTPPETTITFGPTDGTTIVDVTPTLQFTASEASTFTCRIDGGDSAPCTSPYTTPPLIAGPHTIAITATDGIGNADPTPATRTFTLATGLATLVDADHDGYPDALDCNDHAANVHPGALEVPGNAIDENCDGIKAPFPQVIATATLATLFGDSYTKVKALKVADLEAGDTVAVTCTGKGCKRSMRSTTAIKAKTRSLDLSKKIRGVHLKKGATIEVRISHPGFIARVIRFTIMRYHDLPGRTVLCQPPDASKPARC